MKAVNHKCPNCNASLKYNPKSKNWICEYCGGIFSLKDLEKNENKFKNVTEKVKDNSADMDEYYCEDCGAKILADKNTSATFCVYCKNTVLLKNRLTDKFAPVKIIPFTKTKEEAIEGFKKVCKGKLLMPKEFDDPKNIKEITGVYIPFWLYSCDMDYKITGKGNRVSTWSTSDYIYTKTDTYQVERDGQFSFSNIPVDGSTRFNDAIMNSIEPFDYSELVDFNPSYLAGFLSEKYDVEANDAKKICIDRAKESCCDELSGDIGYAPFILENKNGEIKDEKTDYVLLPVWMLNVKYKDKLYTFAMNGETGKMIGDIPYSLKKAVFTWIIIFTISFLIMLFITYVI